MQGRFFHKTGIWLLNNSLSLWYSLMVKDLQNEALQMYKKFIILASFPIIQLL